MESTVIRALLPDSSVRGCVLRAEDQGGDGTLYGHFAVVNQWTTIRSYVENNGEPFLERIAPGAFLRTMAEDRSQMRVLFQHGFDPSVGDKPIAALSVLREDHVGAYYEAQLLGGVPDLLVNGLRAGQYGASFRFRVMRDQFDQNPSRSAYNPDGIAERTINELRVAELGPVTFPAYKSATAKLRGQEWVAA